MNRNSPNLHPELDAEKPDGKKDVFDTKALERALDQWVNEGGNFLRPNERLLPSATASGLLPNRR